MSESINDGGSAFPMTTEWLSPDNSGMSLRDYFAAKALGKCLHEFWGENDAAESAAAAAYQVADAMLAERNKRK